ncbi:MAG: hypothetical protein ACI3YZ_08790 [Prevotella sp.]
MELPNFQQEKCKNSVIFLGTRTIKEARQALHLFINKKENIAWIFAYLKLLQYLCRVEINTRLSNSSRRHHETIPKEEGEAEIVRANVND